MPRKISRTLLVLLAMAAPVGLSAQAVPNQTVPNQPAPNQTELAQPSANLDALFAALDLEAVMGVMRDEGTAYGVTLEQDLFPGAGGKAWEAQVATIYDPARMSAIFLDRLRQELPAQGIDIMVDFFGSARGQRIIKLELSAREALLDDAVEEVADQNYAAMQAENDPRLALLKQFAEVNDLIESNVSGAMNANYAFYVGLVDGGAFPYDMPEQQILSDVWGQEADIRGETESWLYAYLGMAYQPLSDDDLEAYVAFSRTPEAKALNRALFAAFDAMFTGISRDLGLAAAKFIGGQDI